MSTLPAQQLLELTTRVPGPTMEPRTRLEDDFPLQPDAVNSGSMWVSSSIFCHPSTDSWSRQVPATPPRKRSQNDHLEGVLIEEPHLFVDAVLSFPNRLFQTNKPSQTHPQFPHPSQFPRRVPWVEACLVPWENQDAVKGHLVLAARHVAVFLLPAVFKGDRVTKDSVFSVEC